MLSDCPYAKIGFSGRIWAQPLGLFSEAIFLFILGGIDSSKPWWAALLVLLGLSTLVQMSEA
jgi:hypothetical protein